MSANELISLIIVILRISILVPLIDFLIVQNKYRGVNGVIGRMRRTTIAFVFGMVCLISNLVFSRIEIFLGMPVTDLKNSIIFLISTIFCFICTCYAVYQVRKIRDLIDKGDHLSDH